MKKVLKALILILFMCSAKVHGQDNSKSVIIISTYEGRDVAYNKIIVTNSDSVLETIDLIPIYYKTLETNQLLINKTINKYAAAGYNVKSQAKGTLGVGMVGGTLLTTYILEK